MRTLARFAFEPLGGRSLICTAPNKGQACSICKVPARLRRCHGASKPPAKAAAVTLCPVCLNDVRRIRADGRVKVQKADLQPCQLLSLCTAAFHGAELYVQLAPAVGPLLALLRDRASRSQCNAAGALGNLTRHADSVVPHLLAAGAVEVIPAWLL